MITSGKPVGAQKALEMGLVDALSGNDDLEAFARNHARQTIDSSVASDRPAFPPAEWNDEKWEEAIGAIRKKYPDLPIHVHTHDSAGTGVASMVACANAGADAVDTATDSLSGMTSQPSVGAVLASLEGSDLDPGLNVHHVRAIDTYWAQLRLLYSPFEAGLST